MLRTGGTPARNASATRAGGQLDRPISRRLRGVWAAALAVLATVPSATAAHAAGSSEQDIYAPSVAAPFVSVIAPLSVAPMPVYLPSWLPRLHTRVFAFSSLHARSDAPMGTASHTSYEADLSVSAAGPCAMCDAISIRGTNKSIAIIEPPIPVRIAGDIYAYRSRFDGRDWLTWRIGPDMYSLSCSLPAKGAGLVPCSDRQALRIIRAVVRIT